MKTFKNLKTQNTTYKISFREKHPTKGFVLKSCNVKDKDMALYHVGNLQNNPLAIFVNLETSFSGDTNE